MAHGDVLRRITASAQGPSNLGWRNAEVRIFKFDPKTVDTDECFLYQEEDVAAAAGYHSRSTHIETNGHL